MATKKSLFERIMINLKGGHEAHVEKLLSLSEKTWKQQIKHHEELNELKNRQITSLEESYKERLEDKQSNIQEFIENIDAEKIKTHDDRVAYLSSREKDLLDLYKSLDSFKESHDAEIQSIKKEIESNNKSIANYKKLLASLES